MAKKNYLNIIASVIVFIFWILFLVPYVRANETVNGTISFMDVTPPGDMVSTLGLQIGSALALIWGIRKVIRLLNKS